MTMNLTQDAVDRIAKLAVDRVASNPTLALDALQRLDRWCALQDDLAGPGMEAWAVVLAAQPAPLKIKEVLPCTHDY